MDILNEFSKADIIEWLRQHAFFARPKRSELLFIKWQRRAGELQEKWAELSKELKSINLKQRDKYAKQFNATTDPDERAALLAKMAPYDRKLKEYYKKHQMLDRQERAVDRLYESIDEARKAEIQAQNLTAKHPRTRRSSP